MFLSMSNNSNTTHVTTANNHGQISIVKFDMICDFSTVNIHSYSIMNAYTGIRVTDCAAIVCYTVWYALSSNSNSLNTA